MFKKLNEEIELSPILEHLAAVPPLDLAISADNMRPVTRDRRWRVRGIGADLQDHRSFTQDAAHRPMGTQLRDLPAFSAVGHYRVRCALDCSGIR